MRETQAPLAAALACRRRPSPWRTAVVGLYPNRQLIIPGLCSNTDW